MKRLGKIITLLLFVFTLIVPVSVVHAETSKDTFVVGMECNYAPFNWTQVSETKTSVPLEGGGYADGYDVTIARQIADYLGKELVIKKMSWDGLEPALQSGTIDAVIAGMTDTADRRKRVDFTDTYYESQMVLIVRKGDPLEKATSLDDFSNKKVLGQLNTLYDTVIDQIPNVQHATALEDYPAMVMQLSNQLVDAVTAELPVAAGIVATNPDLTYVEFEDGKGFNVDLTDTSVSIAVRKGDTELKDQINAYLDTLSTDDKKELMNAAIDRIPATITTLSDNLFVAAKQIFAVYSPLFLAGIGSTLVLAFSGTILGLLIGLIIGAIRAIQVDQRDNLFIKIVKQFAWFITTVYIEVFRGTPMMVQGAFIYYGLKNIVHWSPFAAGIFVITINTGAYMAEIIRSGIQSVDKGQTEAARSIGMNSVQTMVYIVLPQAIKNSFPSIGNEFVTNIKDSSVLNVIAVTELFYQAKSVAGSLYAFVPTYFVVALIYLCLTFPTTRILNYIETRMNRKNTIALGKGES